MMVEIGCGKPSKHLINTFLEKCKATHLFPLEKCIIFVDIPLEKCCMKRNFTNCATLWHCILKTVLQY